MNGQNELSVYFRIDVYDFFTYIVHYQHVFSLLNHKQRNISHHCIKNFLLLCNKYSKCAIDVSRKKLFSNNQIDLWRYCIFNSEKNCHKILIHLIVFLSANINHINYSNEFLRQFSFTSWNIFWEWNVTRLFIVEKSEGGKHHRCKASFYYFLTKIA